MRPGEMLLADMVDQLAAEALERSPSGRRVNLGSGQRVFDGLESVDLYADSPDIRLDLFERGWSKAFAERKISFAYSSHFVEHVPDFMQFFVDLYEAMEDQALAVILTPYWSSVRAFQDPTHRQSISKERYDYLSRKVRKRETADHYLPDVDFEHAYAPVYRWNRDYVNLSDSAKEYHRVHSLNAVEDIVVFLRCIKNS